MAKLTKAQQKAVDAEGRPAWIEMMSPEWFYAWAGLVHLLHEEHPSNVELAWMGHRGTMNPHPFSFSQGDHKTPGDNEGWECWQYMGTTVYPEGAPMHSFRHRQHPVTGRRESRRIPALTPEGPSWTLSLMEESVASAKKVVANAQKAAKRG